MSKNGPNKVVAAARRRMGGFPPRAPRPAGEFMEWVAAQARAGISFQSAQEAEAAFERRNEETVP